MMYIDRFWFVVSFFWSNDFMNYRTAASRFITASISNQHHRKPTRELYTVRITMEDHQLASYPLKRSSAGRR